MEPTQSPEQEWVQLDPRETYLILSHASIVQTAKNRLPAEDYAAIQQARQTLKDFVRDGGDAARIALTLFGMEFDNTVPPFGDTFANMEQVPFEQALQMWRDAYIDQTN